MDKILGGVRAFRDKVFPKQTEAFQELAKGQSPRAVFVTCADSRVVPTVITQTDPGDLFVIRNAGNIVPPYELGDGVAASLDYAVTVLSIRHIIVCGHSQCCAMGDVCASSSREGAPAIGKWLSHAKAAVRDEAGGDWPADPLVALIQRNVLVQIAHLRSYPCVQAALARGELEIHAWYYAIETGEVSAYDEAAKRFAPL